MNKIALAIGHSERKQGAVNKDSGTTEWGWNSRFVEDIYEQLFVSIHDLYGPAYDDLGIEIFHRTTTIRDLVKHINEWEPDLCIEFHLNSYKEKYLPKFLRFEKEATGTEMLLSKYWNRQWKKLKYDAPKFIHQCSDLTDNISRILEIKDRDVKFRGRFHPKGGYFLNKTKCKAIIAETFFIDNNSDLARANENYDALVQVPVDWIVNYFKER